MQMNFMVKGVRHLDPPSEDAVNAEVSFVAVGPDGEDLVELGAEPIELKLIVTKPLAIDVLKIGKIVPFEVSPMQ
jgi:hypothetical protein